MFTQLLRKSKKDKLLNERWEKVGKFFGTYERLLDSKGRLQIPSKLVKEAFKKIYVLRGFEGCLSLYLEEDFFALMESLSSLSYKDTKARTYVRLATSSVSELEVDAHGRLCLGSELLKRYRISNSVVLIGVLDHVELWDKSTYENYLKEHEETYEEIASYLAKGANHE